MPWATEFNYPGLPIGLRHPAPLYASLFELVVFAVLLWLELRRVRGLQPGDIFLIWISLHGCGRLIMETFRDDYRGAAIFGLSVSSFISILMVIFALGLLRFRHRKTV